MPRIRIEWLNTRTQKQRQALVDRITEAFVDIVKVKPEQVNIVFEEIPTHLLAKGGKFWSDVLKEKKGEIRKKREAPTGSLRKGRIVKA